VSVTAAVGPIGLAGHALAALVFVPRKAYRALPNPFLELLEHVTPPCCGCTAALTIAAIINASLLIAIRCCCETFAVAATAVPNLLALLAITSSERRSLRCSSVRLLGGWRKDPSGRRRHARRRKGKLGRCSSRFLLRRCFKHLRGRERKLSAGNSRVFS